MRESTRSEECVERRESCLREWPAERQRRLTNRRATANCHHPPALLEAGDHVVVTDNTYGGTYRLFERVLRKGGLDFTYVDTTRLDRLDAAIRPNTKLLFLETPTNPTLRVTDLAAASAVARAKGVAVVVDNTFASPAIQRPLDFGADLVLHSTTKYLNGHSDSVGGIVRSEEHTSELQSH